MARTILLADDSVTAQNMGRRILTDAGYEVITVNNGSAALKKIAEHKPDLIVLDVYMPGYGGLEVCNRLKESRETARIPVLLTVGKLEPFKPDEARRVRADAFLIKPFEASELLTALTKLEDKIVPQAQPHKPGRFAKALASIQASEAGEAFGDTETGWKDRLSIPHAPVKSKTPELPEDAVMPPAELGRSEDFKPSEARFERPIPAGLPADITPEEIAAITAAAATITGKEETSSKAADAPLNAEPAAVDAVSEVPVTELPANDVSPADASTAETPVATLASATAEPAETATAEKPEGENQAVAQASGEPVSETVVIDAAPVSETAAIDAAKVQVEVSAAETPAAETAGAEVKAEPAEVPGDKNEKPWARDVEVLAAIASLAPSGAEAAESNSTAERKTEDAFAEAAVGKSSGPRWIAEAVALAEEDPSVNLELELEKAYAASEASRRATLAAVAASPAAQVAVAEVSLSSAGSGGSSEPETQTSAMGVGSGMEAAYAAAAATGSTAEAMPVSEVMAPPAPAAEPGEKLREAEMAAAWENWKRIREAIVGDEFASHIAQAAAAELKANEVETDRSTGAGQESANSDDDGEEAAGDPDGPAAIASIVDSVLAELKPKLVEEIARKMNSEKKAKAKKSKK